MKKYPSLHMNTQYSLLESTISIDAIISYALENKLEHLVITDHNNMYGVAEFIEKCNKNNIKPIIGIDLDIDDFRVILIAKNYQGYQFLTNISSRKARGEGLTVKDIDPSNVVIIDHPSLGHFAKRNQPLRIHHYFAKGYEGSSLSVTPANMLDNNPATNDLLSKISGVQAHESSQYTPIVDDGSVDAEQSISIIKECVFDVPLDYSPLPKLDHNGKSADDVLKQLIIKMAATQLKNITDKQTYKERLTTEMKVIMSQGFSDYFIILHDLVHWAKKQNIVIGPGRGSAAGSLISFVLGITEIDPIKFDLLFERFLNPERISLPDIDIDIQDNRRIEVIEYLFEKYGKDKVALISTFQRIGAKMAIRDAGRAMSLPLRDVDTIAKAIPPNATLAQAYKESAVFAAHIEKNTTNHTLFKKARSLEGAPRQQGTHAAGIVISDRVIKDYVPTTVSSDGKNQVQFTMDYLENHGLLKIDLLGLRNLTILKTIEDQILETHGKKINTLELPLDDSETFKLLSSGDTNGIFQFESGGMRRTLRQVGVDAFDDIPAILSLFRPGPMENIGLYAARKKGQSYDKIHKDFDEIVAPTHGIIIYQEQIMQIAQRFSGMSFGQADILRRAIGKKKIKLIESQKSVFMDGAVDLGHDSSTAEKIYLQIEKFANYGFNKSHAVAYSMLSYRLAYMKSRFAFEFYAALMKASSGSSETLAKYIKEAKSKGIAIDSPSINISSSHVKVVNNKIVLPLTMIKGIGKVAIDSIVVVRGKEPFTNFIEAVHRLLMGNVTENTITLLIEVGAFREFGNIETLLSSLPASMRFSQMIGTGDIGAQAHMMPKLIVRERNLILDMAREKKLFGFNLNAFASSDHEGTIKIVNIKEGTTQEVVFSINSVKSLKDKNGNSYGRYNISDSSSTIDLFVFESDFKYTKITKAGEVVRGNIKCRTHNGKRTYNLVNPWKALNE